MATQTASSPAPSAQVVGNAFVEQYYHILHNSPELVYKFYQDISVLSRPDSNGLMVTVSTMKGINDKICSLDYKNYKAEIETADAQESYKDGVVVLVTGCLTGNDNLRRKFSQSFFLAPQDVGFFVLNDVFRYVEDNKSIKSNAAPVQGIDDTPSAIPIADPEPAYVVDPPMMDPATSSVEEVPKVDEKVCEPLQNEKQVNDTEVVVEVEPHSNENHVSAVAEIATPSAQEDGPKISYASIVSSQTKKKSGGPTKVYVPANVAKVVPMKTEKQSFDSVPHAQGAEAFATIDSSSVDAPESRNAQEEDDGCSVYVRNLPLNVTVAQLEEFFKKFGPIKKGGIQVRSNKQQGFCFGFVEFQDSSSMHNAIQASPITIEDHQVAIEMKKTTTQVGSGRGGRYSSGRGGGFRNDGFRGGRGGYFGGGGGGGGRSFGRNEYGNRGEFSGRGRGPAGRAGEVYQQARGRGGGGGRRGGGADPNAAFPA